MIDGFVKSPSAALRFNFVVARLASGSFYETIVLLTFCEIIMIRSP